MFSARFVCDKCGLESGITATAPRHLVHAAFATGLAFHAAPKTTGNTDRHCEHALTLRDLDWPTSEWGSVRIECLAAGCKERATPTVLETRCPIELVGTVALMFHSAHEGHPFRAWWNGTLLGESPKPP